MKSINLSKDELSQNHVDSYDQHELVSYAHDPDTGLKAYIAVHNSSLGPAVGGCRFYPYQNDSMALNDVLRLSRGMTYKSALAGLPMGGGKAVIIGDHRKIKSNQLLHSMGDFIEQHKGTYITAEDSGTCVADMKVIGERTKFVSGINDSQAYGGDPSPMTAYGVFCGIKAAVNHRLDTSELEGVRIAVQGAGAVGYYLAELLLQAKAEVFIADINEDNLAKAESLGAKKVDVNKILSMSVDVLAPCAMGAVINDNSISSLRTSIIAGGANNQLANSRHADQLQDMGILYAPDFVINAGGIIEIHHQNTESTQSSKSHIEKISNTLNEIFDVSDKTNSSTSEVAESMAQQLFSKTNNRISDDSTASVSDAA